MSWIDWIVPAKLQAFIDRSLRDGGYSSTRIVVLSANTAICVVEVWLGVTACRLSLRPDAAANLGVIGALLTAMGGIVVPLLGFAMNMQNTRHQLAAQSNATSASVSTPAGSASVTTGQ
jgi:hypothetical protein